MIQNLLSELREYLLGQKYSYFKLPEIPATLS
jgi:hypothetical protein